MPLALPLVARAKSARSTPLTFSLKVTVKLRVVSRVGEVPSMAMLVTCGAAASTSTPAVEPTLLSTVWALLPAASRRVAPLASRLAPTAMPLLSCWPLATVRRNTRAVPPEPLT